MFFWRQVVPQSPDEGLKPTATPGYARNFRDLNDQVAQGKSFSGYERNSLFLNKRGRGFAEVGGLLGVDFDDDARAVAVVDWDRDGDLDLWVTNRTAPQVRLLRNNLSSSDAASANSFLAIRLIGNGTTTNRDAIGARLNLSSSSDSQLKQIRTVHAGDGFLSQSSAWTHFGLGRSTGELRLSVRWPGGGTESFSGLKVNSRYSITQGNGRSDVSAVTESSTFASPLAELKVNRQTPKPAAGAGMNGFWLANRVPFPALDFTDENGATRSTVDFLGKPVLINFWATWCAPCIEELGILAKHADEIRSHGCSVLALNVDGLAVDGSSATATNPEELLSRLSYGLRYGAARQENLAKIEILIEYLSSRRSPLAIPVSFLVDANGNVAAVYLEAVSWKQLSTDLTLLGASPAAQLQRASPRPGRWFTDPRHLDRVAFLGDYATLFGKNGFPEESQRLYKMLNPNEGNQSAQDYYNQAKAAAEQGATKQAIEFYRTAIRIDPEYGPALTGLGALLLKANQVEEAQRLFKKALRIDPNHATALINLAMIDRSRGDNTNALMRLRKVIAINPGYAEAQLNLGSLLAAMKRHDEAIQHLTKAVDLNPTMVSAHINLAVVYTKTEQWGKAENHYRRLEQVSPRMAAYSHFGLGNLQARQQQHLDAAASYRKAISLGAKNAQTFTQLGLSLIALGETQLAIDALNNAIELDPEYEGAKRALRKAVALE